MIDKCNYYQSVSLVAPNRMIPNRVERVKRPRAGQTPTPLIFKALGFLKDSWLPFARTQNYWLTSTFPWTAETLPVYKAKLCAFAVFFFYIRDCIFRWTLCLSLWARHRCLVMCKKCVWERQLLLSGTQRDNTPMPQFGAERLPWAFYPLRAIKYIFIVWTHFVARWNTRRNMGTS